MNNIYCVQGGGQTSLNCNGKGWNDCEISFTLNCTDVHGVCYEVDMNEWIVRRLTPIEFERLQGFPDGYTDIPGASDTKRYKALGNSMAVPVMLWIGKRIDDIENTGHVDGAEQ